ncbi:MAG: DUF4388 domain-containing protein [Tepidiformaceae bacterium]
MAEGLTGSLAQLPLSDILTMLGAGGQSGRLELSSNDGRGDVYLRKGAIVHAAVGLKVGEPALSELLGWVGGAFRFQPQVLSPESTIDKPLDQLISESARDATAREALHRIIPSGDAIPRLSREAPPHLVTLQPHEWQIISHVNGFDSINEIAASLRTDEDVVMQSCVPLVTAGLLLIEAVIKAAPVRQTVGPQFWATLTTAVASAMGPLAEIIIDDAVADMNTTRETFPRELVSALAERISSEIRDIDKRVSFQQTMLGLLRNTGMAA